MFAPITLRVHIVAIGIEVFVVVPKSYLGDPFVEFITLYTKNAIVKRCKVRDYRHYPCTRLIEVVLLAKTRSYCCFPTVVVMFPIYIKGVSSKLHIESRDARSIHTAEAKLLAYIFLKSVLRSEFATKR